VIEFVHSTSSSGGSCSRIVVAGSYGAPLPRPSNGLGNSSACKRAGYARRRDAHRGAEAKGSPVAAPRRRLPLVRVAALPEARAERRAGGGVENGSYVRGLRPEALKRQNGLERRKKARKAGGGFSNILFLDDSPPSSLRRELASG
jgi:hypothetical protein